MVVTISNSLKKKQEMSVLRTYCTLGCLYATALHYIGKHSSLCFSHFPSPACRPHSLLCFILSLSHQQFFSLLHSLSRFLFSIFLHSSLHHASYHLPSSLAGLLLAALRSPRSVFSTGVLRWLMSHACLDMLRWSVNVMLTYARLAAVRRAGAKTRPWCGVEGRG